MFVDHLPYVIEVVATWLASVPMYLCFFKSFLKSTESRNNPRNQRRKHEGGKGVRKGKAMSVQSMLTPAAQSCASFSHKGKHEHCVMQRTGFSGSTYEDERGWGEQEDLEWSTFATIWHQDLETPAFGANQDSIAACEADHGTKTFPRLNIRCQSRMGLNQRQGIDV